MTDIVMNARDQGSDVSPPRMTRAVLWLIAINVAVFFVQLTLVNPLDVQQALGFRRSNLGQQWWTIGTYMFVHDGFWHLALNMYVLWQFGPRLEWRWGSRDFVRYYLFCGLGAWFAHLALGGGTSLVGAAGAVLGVALAFGTLWGDERVFVLGSIPTRTRWLAVALGGIVLVVGVVEPATQDGAAYLAHLGGVAAGLLYLRTTATVSLSRLRKGVSQVPDEPDDVPPRAVPRALPRSRARERENIDDLVARSNAAVANHPAPRPLARDPLAELAELAALDRLLDKISAHGIESLSREERKLLDEASRRLRDS